ncbi:MAG: hypothetical protein JSS51_13410 [Planctomycetes bacterium]|nr:hypothetical protein [Planctomycetota bacterium]
MTRTGQIAAVALASLAGVVLAVGIPGLAVPKNERTVTADAVRPADPGVVTEMPAIMQKRATSIAQNLSQIGNAPKPPPEVVENPGDESTGTVAPTAPVPAPEVAVTFLGTLGSGARPMALVSIDSHQQVLAVGDVIHKSTGETIKLVKVEKNQIEVEIKGATKKIELAARSGATYTTLQNNTPAPSPVAAPASPVPAQSMPVGRPRRENSDGRPPGARRFNPQRADESGGARE